VNRAEIAKRWKAGIAALTHATSPPPKLSRWAWAADAILALVLSAAVLGNVGGDQPDVRKIVRVGPLPVIPDVPAPPAGGSAIVVPGDPGVPTSLLVLAVLTALPLVVRRRYPLSAFWAVILAALLLSRDSGGDTSVNIFLSCLIAGYSAAMYSPYQAATVASLVTGAVLITADNSPGEPALTPGYAPFFVLIAAGLAANTIHTWKQRVRVLEAEHEATTRGAVERERSRIARELHDVVTHNVSVMVIQAGAARKVMDAAPDQAREALLAVESGGRAAMAELRHVMGLLTMDSDGPDPAATADLAPQPGLGQVPVLADRIRDTGVPVELTVTGAPAPLSPGADLAAYRVVQEALTNTVKHAAGASVRIAVDYAPGEVRVEVADSGGRPTSPAGSGNGRGLTGLRERLAVYGGTLQSGPRPTGGYRLRAVIPVEDL
jgi:signal transduction histidine kinase